MKELNVQQTIDGVRYQLPGRSLRKGLGGIPLILFGSFFAGIPITMVVVSISQLFRPDDGMPWWGVLMMTLFATPFILIGSAILIAGLWMMAGNTRVRITHDRVKVSNGFGPFRFTRSRQFRQIKEVAIVPAESTQDALDGKAELSLQMDDGNEFDFAGGHSEYMLREIADEIARRASCSLRDATQVAEGSAGKASFDDDSSDSFQTADVDNRRRDVVLSTDDSQTGALALIFFAVVWNGITYTILTVMILSGDTPIFPFIILGIFALVGLVLIYAAVHHLMSRAKMHPPTLTISIEPLCLGETFQVAYEQAAKSAGKLNGVQLRLICQEQATYRQGTSTHTVTHDALSESFEVLGEGNLDRMKPLMAKTEMQIPFDAMHSFSSDRNEIKWLIECHVDIPSWPDHKTVYALNVLPHTVQSDDGSR